MPMTTTKVVSRAALGILTFAFSNVARQERDPAWPGDLTRADVVVTDASGATIPGLAGKDFEVRVNGDVRAIEFFSAGPTPLTLVILVDVTASLHLCPAGVAGIPSTAGPRTLSSVRNTRLPGNIPPAVDEFPLEGIQPGDRVRIGSISRTPILSEQFVSEARQISRDWKSVFKLPPIEWLGSSPIYDTVFEAVTVAAEQPGLRAVVVLTDGQASGNRHGLRETADLAARKGVSVSFVAEGIMTATFPMRPLSDFGIDLTRDLKAMAELTGGLVVFDNGVWNQEGVCYVRYPSRYLSGVIGSLRQGYVLGFKTAAGASGGNAASKLDVRVNRPGAVAHVRRSFVP